MAPCHPRYPDSLGQWINLVPVSGKMVSMKGGARRDVVRQEQQNVKDAITHATEAVEHGEQGHVDMFSAVWAQPCYERV
jgi:hypothetical protein